MNCEIVNKTGLLHNKITYDLIVYVLSFFLIFIKIPGLNQIYNYFRYLIILIVGFYIFLNIKLILKSKENLLLNIFIFLLSTWCIFSSLINNSKFERNLFLASIVHYASFVEVVLVLEISFYKNQIKKFLKILLILYVVFLSITDLQILFLRFDDKRKEYFIGNKFDVSYAHLKFLSLYMFMMSGIRKKKTTFKNIVIIAISFLTSIIIKSSVGIISFLLVLFFVVFQNKIGKIVKNKIVFFSLYLLSFSFVFWYNILINYNFIVLLFDVLGENISNMSGRQIIYDNIVTICSNNWLYGYGYGSTYELIFNLLRIADTQNGLWELILTSGVVGALLYTCILFFPYFSKQKFKSTSSLYFYVFIMIVIGFIEISYVTSLLFFSILIYLYEKDMWRRKYAK